ncbi:MAG: alpha-amylase family glycosyl hydrolase [Burkholderiaceae bacterium]
MRRIRSLWPLATPAAAGLSLAVWLLLGVAPLAAAPPLKLHVPSPDWRDQIIYFAVTDRFADGNPRNNDQGAGEFDPRNPSRFSGGDLKGLRQGLNYIQGLGATALWITPPVANQWLNAQGSYSGYHGYWAEHFMKVDRHFGTLQDYRLLSDALHRRGMHLVQDIVVNHVGDFFHIDAQGQWQLNQGSKPVTAPTQWPFRLNKGNRAEDRRAGIYHWTPDIRDYTNREQELRWQMSGLDDLNTTHARVREALRRSYAHWIREVGVDAFRVDTAFYVEPEFFEDFIWRPANAGGTPGMAEVARRTGRGDFFLFGEGFGIDPPGQTTQSRRIESYMQGEQPAQRRLHGMLNFPLYGAIGDVIGRGAPTAVLGQRLRSQVALHPRLHWMPTFLDNHDVDRFLASADERALVQALGTLFTLPGIPVLYYGTEQGFTQQRAAMFAAGWGSGGRDHFNLDHPLAQQVRSLAQLRQAHKALRRGWPTILAETTDDAGALVWRMSHEGRHVLVALNTADEAVTVAELGTGSQTAVQLQPAWAIDATAPQGLKPQGPLVSDAQGRITISMGPRDLRVWHWTDPELTGTARAATPQAEPPMALQQQASGDANWRTVLDVQDPADDDRGPEGRYTYPTDPSYGQLRPADIRRVQVATRAEAQGEALRITLTMAGLSTVWSPRNGFDHVAFTAFIELPGEPADGARVMPLQDGELPSLMRWHRRLRAHGWSLALFDARGAGSNHEGTPLARGVKVSTDAAQKTVSFTLSASALGKRASLSGAKLWVNTWDWDARYRALAAEPQGFVFGGGAPGQPRVMDTTEVLTLP